MNDDLLNISQTSVREIETQPNPVIQNKNRYWHYILISIFAFIILVLLFVLTNIFGNIARDKSKFQNRQLPQTFNQTSIVPTEQVIAQPTTQEVKLQQSITPTVNAFQYNYLTSTQYLTKVTNFLKTANPNFPENNETKILIAKAQSEYETLDPFTKWTISNCPEFSYSGVVNFNLPFQVDNSYGNSYIVECQTSNAVFTPILAFFSITPKRTPTFSLHVLGKSAVVDGMEPYGFTAKQVLESLDKLPIIQNTKFEIKNLPRSDQTYQTTNYLISAYRLYDNFLVVAQLEMSSPQEGLINASLNLYPNVNEELKVTIDQLLNAVNLVKPI